MTSQVIKQQEPQGPVIHLQNLSAPINTIFGPYLWSYYIGTHRATNRPHIFPRRPTG